MTLPGILLILTTIAFLIAERAHPGRQLPHSTGWYLRSVGVNFVQLGVTLGVGAIWP